MGLKITPNIQQPPRRMSLRDMPAGSLGHEDDHGYVIKSVDGVVVRLSDLCGLIAFHPAAGNVRLLAPGESITITQE